MLAVHPLCGKKPDGRSTKPTLRCCALYRADLSLTVAKRSRRRRQARYRISDAAAAARHHPPRDAAARFCRPTGTYCRCWPAGPTSARNGGKRTVSADVPQPGRRAPRPAVSPTTGLANFFTSSQKPGQQSGDVTRRLQPDRRRVSTGSWRALAFDAATPLNLANISAVYRRGWLAHKMRLSVRELLLLVSCTGLDPFASPDAPTAGNPAIVQTHQPRPSDENSFAELGRGAVLDLESRT